MGYILLPPEYIENANSNNWHIFNAKRVSYKKISIYNSSICTIDKDEDYQIKARGNCIIKPEGFDKVPFTYILPNEQNGLYHFVDYYYTFYNKTSFYYSNNEDIIRIIASIIGKETCGNCMQIMHGKEN